MKVLSDVLDWLKRAWFGLSVAALAILYLLFEKRGRDIARLKADAEFDVIDRKIDGLANKVAAGEMGRDEAIKKYESLRRIHGALLDKLYGHGGDDETPPTEQ